MSRRTLSQTITFLLFNDTKAKIIILSEISGSLVSNAATIEDAEYSTVTIIFLSFE